MLQYTKIPGRPRSSWTNATEIRHRQTDRWIDRRASISKGALRGHKMSLRISQSPFLRGSDGTGWVGREGGQLLPPLAGSIPQVSMVSAESIISHTMACNYKGQLCATAACRRLAIRIRGHRHPSFTFIIFIQNEITMTCDMKHVPKTCE